MTLDEARAILGPEVEVRYDSERAPDAERWTAYILGRGRGDGRTQGEALDRLVDRLADEDAWAVRMAGDRPLSPPELLARLRFLGRSQPGIRERVMAGRRDD